MATVYPSNVKLLIDGVDVTYWVFGVDTLTITDINRKFRDIDISPYVHGDGEHLLEVTCTDNVGRVEARIETS